jgi:hypothetical protein
MKPASGKELIEISAPQFCVVHFPIRGVSPLVQLKFSEKAREEMTATQRAGSAGKKKKRDPKDFDELYKQAAHRTAEGRYGIPCSAFRNAMISACRTVGIPMTRAKLALFVVADGYDNDGTALVHLIGEPAPHYAHARNASGVIDIRVRPMWKTWSAVVCVRFDESMIGKKDVANLMVRAGLQVGVGEGRPDSRMSAGVGWGLFELVKDEEKQI